jgi:RNA polymerase sigma factor (sigma-70 family)
MDEINTNLTDATSERFTHYLQTRVLESLDAETTNEEEEKGINQRGHDDRTPEWKVIMNENIELLELIKDALRRCLASLSAQEQMLIQLEFWHGKKPRDIARLMSISAKKASKAAITAVKKLRMCVQQQGYRPEVIVETLSNLEIL